MTAGEIFTLFHAGNGVQDAPFNPAPAYADPAIRSLGRSVADPDDDALVGHFDAPGDGAGRPDLRAERDPALMRAAVAPTPGCRSRRAEGELVLGRGWRTDGAVRRGGLGPGDA